MPRGKVSLILRSSYVATGIDIDSKFDCILLTVVFN